MAMNSTNGVQNAIQEIGDLKIPPLTTTIVEAIHTQTKETGSIQTVIVQEHNS